MLDFILSKFIISPFFWLFLFLTIIMIFWAIKTKNEKSKIIISNLVGIPLSLLVLESFCWILNTGISQNMQYVSYSPKRSLVTNQYLSYSLRPNIKIHVVQGFQKKKGFDVYYTINKDGLRNVPSSNDHSNQCLLFYGCSYIFGDALNDNETLPSLVGEKTHHKYKIYNLAYSGYGPHQMLSSMEHSLSDKTLQGCKNSIVIYEGMPDHIRRIAGKKYWNAHDPKYSLINNEAVYQGPFHKQDPKIVEFIKFIVHKSQIYINVTRIMHTYKGNLSKKEEIEYEKLYFAILKKSKKISQEKYNANRFIILFWDLDNAVNFKNYDFAKAFNENSFEYYIVKKILPGGFQGQYFIENNGHPTKLANEIIADFLAKKLNSKGHK